MKLPPVYGDVYAEGFEAPKFLGKAFLMVCQLQPVEPLDKGLPPRHS